ncbi:cobalamin-binding protein [Castellaniella hirudinis]|uniref:cobalamin-binding protein n=1 Tax=Castellaniella hirudinis TaxID=1144617 RepID=UPI0039C11A63
MAGSGWTRAVNHGVPARLAAAVCALALAWGAPAPAGAGPAARAATAPLTAPHRVITLAPSVTELVYAAGAGASIVGTVLHSDYPPAARDIPRVGDGVQPSDEAVLALRPTLVAAWYPTEATQALAHRLQPLGIPLVYANPQSLDDIPRLVRQLGRQLDTAAQADSQARDLQRRIDALGQTRPDAMGQTGADASRASPPRAAATADAPPVSVFIEISADPLYTLGNTPLINDILTRCGGVNPYADSPIAAPQVSVETVLHLNPQVLIVSPYGHETLAARTRWWADHGLSAARAGRVYAVNPDWLHRPGPRLVDAAEVICEDLAQGESGARRPSGQPSG